MRASMLVLAAPLFFPWDDLLIEFIFAVACWVPIMALETYVEYRLKCGLMKKEHQFARDLMHEQHILEQMAREEEEEEEDENEE